MRLRYARSTGSESAPNFGDLLNPLIFDKLLPGYFDEDYPDVDLLGIGTTLGMLIPVSGPQRRTVVFSSGLGGASDRAYGHPPRLNKNFDFVCVRGPLTAKALELSSEMAVTDGALLLRALVDTPSPSKDQRPVFVPHMSSVIAGGRWQAAADAANIKFVDPCTEDILSVIDAVAGAPLVLAEAMHAAIVADTFGVPWLPVTTNSTINEFKWNDWCQSLDVDYQPLRIPPLLGEAAAGQALRSKMSARFNSTVHRLASRSYEVAIEPVSFRLAVSRLKKAANSPSYLSAENTRASKLEQLLERVNSLKERYPL